MILGFILPLLSLSQNISNRGREFWVGYGHHQFMETGTNTQDMVLYLSAEDQPATVTVTIDSSGPFPSIPAFWWRKTYNIPAYTVIASDIIPKGDIDPPTPADANYDARLWNDPPPANNGGCGLFRGKSVRITSNVPIVAYAHIYGSASSGASMLFPVEAWGYSYVSVNSKQTYASNCYNWTYVVASRDNTVIEITPSVKTRGQNFTGLSAGAPTVVTLMKGQIYQLIGANLTADANGNGGTSSSGLELTGSRIRSLPGPTGECYPIAVFAGSSRTANPSLTCGAGSSGDNDNQQLFPLHAWGKKYLLAPLSNSASASNFMTNLYKVAVRDPNTVVRRNGTVLTGLIANSYYYFESNTADIIESDKPVMVAQFMTSSCLSGVGDPEMVVLSPIEQATKKVGFYRNNVEGIDVNYLTLIVPTAGVASLRIDGSAIFSHTYAHPNAPGYSVVVKRWAPAAKDQALVSCDSAFIATTYGLGSVESYAYNAGTFINNLGALPYLHNSLDPATPQHPFTCVGSPVELSALISYKPATLLWHLDSLAAVINPNTPVTMTNPVPNDSIIVKGVKYYKYTLPGTYQFSDTGTFYLPLKSTHPAVENCNNTELLRVSIVVKPSPKPDFTFTHTGCTLDTVYFAGQNLAGGSFTLGQWQWTFPPSVNATGQNVKQIIPPGTHNILLTGISMEGCVGDTIKTITVHPKPTATFGITPPSVCFPQPVTLSDTSFYAGTAPTMNNWYWNLGDGNIINNTTNANVVANYLAPGTYTIKHVVKVTNLCISDTAIKTVVISPEAQINFTYPVGCLPTTGLAQFGAAATDLGGIPITSYNWNFGDPASGASNTSTLQNPTHTYTTFGTYPVTLSVATSSGCAGDTTVNLSFSVTPLLAYAPLSPICSNSAPVSVAFASVTNGVPGAGVYSGAGTTAAGMFDPAVAGPGPHVITYTYTTPDCFKTITQTITVFAPPVISAGTYPAVCINAAPVTLAGSPAGGTFSGTGITGNTFNPATAGAGTHVITYNYTDANGCSNTVTTNITVNPLPVVNAGVYLPVCVNAAPVTLSGTPAGGSYSGPGVAGNTFVPATAGTGTHTITYTYTNANGCVNSATTTITVNALPAVNAGTYGPLCINAPVVTLAGTPGPGLFSGTGVTGSQFNAATAGAGTHTISYLYADVNGCVNTSTTTITVNALPVVSAGTYAPVCISASAVALAGTPAGGTFSGAGITGNNFNPATAGVGNHTITYAFTDINGCSNTTTTSITVYALPVVSAGTYTAMCVDATPVTLTGSPVGGTFTGPGITGNSFNPSTAGAGTHTVTYLYNDGAGCSNTATATITVNPLPTLNAGTYPAVCISATPVTLAGTPVGGVFSGPGVTGNTFNPATAGSGNHTITYGAVNGCRNAVTTSITVHPLPVVNAGTYAAVCIDASALTLTGSPAGGTFGGPGVTGTTFSPATAGAGTHSITYSYTDGNGCSNTATASIVVNPLPVVNAGVYNAVCIDGGAVTLNGTPIGGTFSGTGVAGNIFTPSLAGAGTHTITYNFSDANGCSKAATATITVNPLPVVNAGTYTPLCEDANAITLNGSPAGGTFSGNGVEGNNFNPAVAGAGTHTITYSYRANTGCTQTNTASIVVYPRPVSSFTTANSICLDGAATLTSTSIVSTGNITTWNWNLGDGNTQSNTNGNPFTITYSTANSYTVKLETVSDRGCLSLPFTQVINVRPLPAVNFTLPAGVCMPGGNAVFSNQSSVPDNSTLTYQWTFGDGGSATAANPTHVYASSGSYNVTLVATSSFGCDNQATQVLDDFFDKPVAGFTVNVAEICQGQDIRFRDASTAPNSTIQSWNWDFGNNGKSTVANPTYRYTSPGKFDVKLTVSNALGCTSDPFIMPVTVHLQPVIDAGQSFVVPQGTTVQFTATANSSNLTFNWTPPLGLSDAKALKPTLVANADQVYTLTATGDFGCTATDFISVKILKPVTVPNIFTPNGDGIHDRWEIANLSDYTGCTVEIFNRYGQQVYYSSGYGTPWDGNYKGKAVPVGTYYYVIKLENGFKPITGSVTIVR